jgi:hypothetical protein
VNPTDYASAIEAIWRANAKNAADVAKQSLQAFPLPPIMANLEIMSHGQFSKLLADVQKRSFYLGAMAMATAMEEYKRRSIQ